MKTQIALIACAVALCGCVGGKHERVNADGSREVTKFHSFLSTTAVKGLSDATKETAGTNSYSRTFRLTDGGTQTEIEKLAPLLESISKGAAEGAAKGVKP